LISIKNDLGLPCACGGATGGEAHGARRLGPGELRCGCGSLLARLVAGAVELKCRRCKRTWRVPLAAT
jgi:hypothetical protein